MVAATEFTGDRITSSCPQCPKGWMSCCEQIPGIIPPHYQGRDSPVHAQTLSAWQNSWLDLFLPICLSLL